MKYAVIIDCANGKPYVLVRTEGKSLEFCRAVVRKYTAAGVPARVVIRVTKNASIEYRE